MIDEKELITQCLENKAKAQKQLYKMFASKMFGVCLRYARRRSEAEDLLQEGFIKVFQNLATFNFLGSLEGWIRRIMITTAINYYRKDLRYDDTVDIENEENALSDINFVQLKLTQEDIVKFIQQLPPSKRMVFNMYVFEGFSHRDIAESLNITESTSKAQLAKARQILKNYFEKYF